MWCENDFPLSELRQHLARCVNNFFDDGDAGEPSFANANQMPADNIMEPSSLGDGVPRHSPSTCNQSNTVLDSIAPRMAHHQRPESGYSSLYMAANALSITHA